MFNYQRLTRGRTSAGCEVGKQPAAQDVHLRMQAQMEAMLSNWFPVKSSAAKKKSGVENPEWDISICAIVGLPLKKISFVIVYLSKCVSWLFWGIQYTIIRMVYPIFGQTCLPNCCIINSVPSIPHIITAHTHMFAVRIPPYQQTNGSHTRINGSLYLQTYKHTHISYTV